MDLLQSIFYIIQCRIWSITNPLSPSSAQVSIIGSEAWFSPCSHPDQKEPNRQRRKKVEKRKTQKNYNTEYNKLPSSLCNFHLNADSVGCITALSDNEFHSLNNPYMKKTSHLQYTPRNHNFKCVSTNSSINGHCKPI